MAILIFILVVLFSIIAHEFGHYIACRSFGCRVDNFSVGMGKKNLLSINKWGTNWNLKPFLVGGSCEINDVELDKLSPIKKIVVFLSGVTVNLIICLISAVMLGKGNPFTFLFNLIKTLVVNLGPALSETVTSSQSGIMQNIDTINSFNSISLTYSILTTLLCINIILAIFNLLPVPALDGGQIVLELPALFGHPLPKQAQYKITQCGYAAVMGITVLIFIKEFILMGMSAIGI